MELGGENSGWSTAIHNGIHYKLPVFMACINLIESDKAGSSWLECVLRLPHVAKNIRTGNVVSVIAVLGSIPEVLYLITV